VLVVYLQECHESLAGIIAGKLKEIYYKPTFVLTDSEDGLKGSGRSVEGYSMYEELVKADTIYQKQYGRENHLLKKYGGHTMAAGLSLGKDKVDIFRKLLNDSDGISEDMLIRKIWIDVPLPFEYISESLIEQLELLEPFGMGNEKPVFAEKCSKVISIKIFGKNRNVISLNLENTSGYKMEAIYFEDENVFLKNMTEKYGEDNVKAALQGKDNNIAMNVIYYPEVNEYRGFKNIRVVIKRYS
jgi:single-stranded-DNA-specific exonuclease